MLYIRGMVPKAGNANCNTGDLLGIFIENSGPGLEACIVFPYVQILVFIEAVDNVS